MKLVCSVKKGDFAHLMLTLIPGCPAWFSMDFEHFFKRKARDGSVTFLEIRITFLVYTLLSGSIIGADNFKCFGSRKPHPSFVKWLKIFSDCFGLGKPPSYY